MLGDVADDGYKNDTDEKFRPGELINDRADGADQKFREPADAERGQKQNGQAFFDTPFRLVFFNFFPVEVFGGVKRKKQTGNVNDNHGDGDKDTQLFDLQTARSAGCPEKNGWHEEGDDGDQQGRAVGLGHGQIEFLFFEFAAAEKHGCAEDQKQIAEDGAGDGGLDHLDKACAQSENADDELG